MLFWNKKKQRPHVMLNPLMLGLTGRRLKVPSLWPLGAQPHHTVALALFCLAGMHGGLICRDPIVGHPLWLQSIRSIGGGSNLRDRQKNLDISSPPTPVRWHLQQGAKLPQEGSFGLSTHWVTQCQGFGNGIFHPLSPLSSTSSGFWLGFFLIPVGF